MYNKEDNAGFGLRDLLFIFAKHLKLIAAVTFGLALIIFILSKFVVSPKYEADASVAVNAIEVAGNFERNSQSSDNFQLSQAILNSSVEVMKSSSVMDETIHKLGLDTDADHLSRDVKVTPVANSEVINISVSYKSVKQVKQIEQEIILVSQQKMSKLYQGITVDTVAPPKLSDNVSPNVMLYTILGFLAGLFISCLCVFLAEKLSTKIISEKGLRALDLPILGIIPTSSEKTSTHLYFADHLINAVRYGDFSAIAVTSALPDEHKQAIVADVAVSMASRGQRVLVIEADQSAPCLEQIEKSAARPDPSAEVKGIFSADGRVASHSFKGIEYISAKGGFNITSADVTEFIKKANGSFDLVLIHVPSAALFGNLPTYALLPVGFVLAVRQSVSDYIPAMRAINRLKNCNANLIGCVMGDYDYHVTDNFEEYNYYRHLSHNN